jgi:diadenosine tetraphosphatase ApaH/serine/threonine PP2A family protein phosphatase
MASVNPEKECLDRRESHENQLVELIYLALAFAEERDKHTLSYKIGHLLEKFQTKQPNLENEIRAHSHQHDSIKLADALDEIQFCEMLEDFKLDRMLNYKYTLKIIDKTIKLLEKKPNVQQITLSVDENEECIIVGDLHGSFDDLNKIIERYGVPGKHCYFVFNGDYIDRGDKQIQVLLTIFYSFILYPDKVFINKGNHEFLLEKSARLYLPNLKHSTLKHFDIDYEIIYEKFKSAFDLIPFATIINNPKQEQRLFVVHGGVNDQIKLDELNKIDRNIFSKEFRAFFNHTSTKNNEETKGSMIKNNKEYQDAIDLFWSDPRDEVLESEFNTDRNFGNYFGSNVTQKFLDSNSLTFLIRSHECMKKGYNLFHSGKVLSIFSSSDYSNKNFGAVLKISSFQKNYRVTKYFTQKLTNENPHSEQKDNLVAAINSLKKHLVKHKHKIIDECLKEDKTKSGFIEINKLTAILNEHVAGAPFNFIIHRLCECEINKAKYNTLFF